MASVVGGDVVGAVVGEVVGGDVVGRAVVGRAVVGVRPEVGTITTAVVGASLLVVVVSSESLALLTSMNTITIAATISRVPRTQGTGDFPPPLPPVWSGGG